MMDELASGESEFQGALDQHVQECAACRAFFDSQTSLLRAIDSNLRLIGNGAVPASLLPGVRARLQDEVSPRTQWISSWGFAAIAALVVLSLTVTVQWRRQEAPKRVNGSAPLMAFKEENANRSRPTDRRAPMPAPHPIGANVSPKTIVAVPSSTPEILISREEQAAFAHFVTKLSRDREIAIALTSAAPESGDVPVEIALLTIKSVEVAPLEGTDSE
jgi:hypothetical protein